MKSGCSTAGCHGDEVSWEMQVGKQARHHYCPVGGGRINKHPPHFKTPVWVRLLQVLCLAWHLQGFIVLCKMA